jgi:predicted Zn-dependent protease
MSTMSTRLLLLAAACASILAAGGCATNPVTGKSDIVTMSAAQEVEIGRRMHPQVLQEYGRYADEELQAYVSDLGQRIAAASHRPDLQYTFTVLDSEQVNAFALPGGYVYITRGIMAYLNSEAELAAVIGHEVGHVTARHAVRQQTGATAAGVGATVVGILTGSGDLANIANMAGTAVVRGYGRDMELEADSIGAQYLVRLGYSPEAMIDVVRLLKNQETLEVQIARQEGREPRVYHGVFSTHPDNDTRLREVVASAGKVGDAEARPDGRDAYLQAITGLPLGPSREQGVVRGNRFYHGTLGMTVAFPSGWSIQNQPTKVVGMAPQQDAFLQVSAAPPPPGVQPRDLLTRSLAGVPLASGQPLEFNGLQGYTAIAREVGLPWGNRGPARVAVVYYNGLAYQFVGGSRLNASFAATDPLLLSSIKTFRRLRDNELRLAEPNRIKLVQVAPGTRIEQLAVGSPIEKYPVERLRLLNDLYPDKQPAAGQRLKVVE